MTEVSTIGLDLAKNVLQAHGADAVGGPVWIDSFGHRKDSGFNLEKLG